MARRLLLKGGVKGDGAGFEVQVLDEIAGLGGAVLAIHAAVLPLDGERAVDVDLAHHVKLVHADATGASNDPALQKADELLLRWASRSVDVDTEAFTARVLLKLRTDERRLRPRRTVFRFGVPAAAAAVVMLAASAWLAFGPGEDARCYVDYGIPVMQPIGSGLAAQAVVSFAQPRDQAALTPRPALIGYMTLGSGPVAPPNWEDSFPL